MKAYLISSIFDDVECQSNFHDMKALSSVYLTIRIIHYKNWFSALEIEGMSVGKKSIIHQNFRNVRPSDGSESIKVLLSRLCHFDRSTVESRNSGQNWFSKKVSAIKR